MTLRVLTCTATALLFLGAVASKDFHFADILIGAGFWLLTVVFTYVIEMAWKADWS